MDVAVRAAIAAISLALAGIPAFAADKPPGIAATAQQEGRSAAAAASARQDATSAADSNAISAIESTGRTIFEHDRAAAVATDVARAERAFKRDKRVRGWLTEARDGGIVVTVVDDTPSALYRVLVSADGEPSPLLPLEAPTPLSAFESGAATARRLALESPFQPCSKTYNTVVLPDTSFEGGWVVYLLRATTSQNEVPLGGTYRVEVRDGAVAGHRAFTRSCVVLGRGPNVGAMMVSHIMDPMPTEAHVYWSLWADTPMYVSTEEGLWKIEQGRVRPVSDSAEN